MFKLKVMVSNSLSVRNNKSTSCLPNESNFTNDSGKRANLTLKSEVTVDNASLKKWEQNFVILTTVMVNYCSLI